MITIEELHKAFDNFRESRGLPVDGYDRFAVKDFCKFISQTEPVPKWNNGLDFKETTVRRIKALAGPHHRTVFKVIEALTSEEVDK